jgi:hypothetical protein
MLKRNDFLIELYRDIRYLHYKKMSDEKLIRTRFRKVMGREVELKNPVNYNDKLQWLKLNWYDPIATKCADKYEVRLYVKDKIGEKYLNELYGVYETVDEIDVNKLPQSFVLKATHGSGDNIICENKERINWSKELNRMNRALKKNLYWTTREWVYKDIKPRIICERYLRDESGRPPMDYKIFCFNGTPSFIQVDADRFGKHKQNFFNTDWTPLNIEVDNIPNENLNIERPTTLEEMLELSHLLSKDFPHVRVDFYNIGKKIIFGELTFFHRNGLAKFHPPHIEERIGSLLNLPDKKTKV